jgi:hypothetical protein
MQGSHVDARPQQKHLLAVVTSPETDILRSGRDNVGKKLLMFPVIVRKKSADGINPFVLGFKKGSEILIRTCFFHGIIHAVWIFVVIGDGSQNKCEVNICINRDNR